MDEADRILNMDFEVDLDKILKILPPSSTRSTYLYSATMTKKVAKLQQAYLFIPAKHKDVYLVSILNDMTGKSIIVFTSTCTTTLRLALLTRNLGFTTVPLHGQMSQVRIFEQISFSLLSFSFRPNVLVL
jgi:ATP-dependent RNA helicase DDX47/RRP3